MGVGQGLGGVQPTAQGAVHGNLAGQERTARLHHLLLHIQQVTLRIQHFQIGSRTVVVTHLRQPGALGLGATGHQLNFQLLT